MELVQVKYADLVLHRGIATHFNRNIFSCFYYQKKEVIEYFETFLVIFKVTDTHF